MPSHRVDGRMLAAVAALLIVACHHAEEPDAYGNFEATETVVSAQTPGALLWFTPMEGQQVAPGNLLGVVDTAQLALERAQARAQSAAVRSRVSESGRQVEVLAVQRDFAQRAYERTRRLFAEHAATAQQLDQTEGEYRTLGEQIAAARVQQQSAVGDARASDARVAQLTEQISRSRVMAPLAGTVLATYARKGEFVQPGQPLFRIANLDSLTLRAYVTEPQLTQLRIGQRVQVSVDRAGERLVVPGTVTWVASKAEFTPTPVQTRDERADLVYAVKIWVVNRGGALKIGMPADVSFPSLARS
ncbi:MAG: HlyD family efflux transporter periplasmic adaptor subunit [Gemmatimonadetes bacterium]|nr:HlyD family efflux transporter periplasmic adaptor subunit [Gemmatimonadota bacterium]